MTISNTYAEALRAGEIAGLLHDLRQNKQISRDEDGSEWFGAHRLRRAITLRFQPTEDDYHFERSLDGFRRSREWVCVQVIQDINPTFALQGPGRGEARFTLRQNNGYNDLPIAIRDIDFGRLRHDAAATVDWAKEIAEDWLEAAIDTLAIDIVAQRERSRAQALVIDAESSTD